MASVDVDTITRSELKKLDKAAQKSVFKDLLRAENLSRIEALFGAKNLAKAREKLAKKGKSASSPAKGASTPSSAKAPYSDAPASTPAVATAAAAASPPASPEAPATASAKAATKIATKPARALGIAVAITPKPSSGTRPKVSTGAATTGKPAAGNLASKAKRRLATVAADGKAMPRRPLSSYMLFVKDNRPAVVASGLSGIADIGRRLGEMWRELPAAERQVYEAAHTKDKERYHEECKARGIVPTAKKSKAPPKKGRALAKARKAKPAATGGGGTATKAASSSKPSGPSVLPPVSNDLLAASNAHLDENGFVYDEEEKLLWADELEQAPCQRRAIASTRRDPSVGDSVMVVLPAYREMLETLRTSTKGLGDTTAELLDAMHLSALEALTGLVQAEQSGILGPLLLTAQEALDHTDCPGAQKLALRIGAANGGGGDDDGEAEVSLLYFPHNAEGAPSADDHLLLAERYQTAVNQELLPGTQVTAPFLAPDDAHQEELHEARVYYVGPADEFAKDAQFRQTPYRSIRVVFYAQHVKTGAWSPCQCQTDNELSPWDVEVGSSYVRSANTHVYSKFQPVIASARDALKYLARTEAAMPFLQPVADPAYLKRVKHPLCLRELQRRAQAGKYNGNKDAVWKDLKIIVSNAKKFNQPESWVWRAADMLDKEARRCRRKMAAAGPGTQSRVTIPPIRLYDPGYEPGKAAAFKQVQAARFDDDRVRRQLARTHVPEAANAAAEPGDTTRRPRRAAAIAGAFNSRVSLALSGQLKAPGKGTVAGQAVRDDDDHHDDQDLGMD